MLTVIENYMKAVICARFLEKVKNVTIMIYIWFLQLVLKNYIIKIKQSDCQISISSSKALTQI